MSQTDKASLYKILKEAGVAFDKHYREYSTTDLQAAVDRLQAAGAVPTAPVQPAAPQRPAQPDPVAAEFFGYKTEPAAPVRAADPNEMAGQRLNSKPADEVIRVDEQGRQWLQEEVLKPAFPKPRGRRVLTYQDPGVVQKTVQNGDYSETFEVSGDPANARPAEVKITLPSYQVGVYRDRRFPFKIVTYNGNNGFDLQDVQKFYGGAELVPAEVKRVYIENTLCYDIRTTIRAIQAEARQQQLTGNRPA